jgi:hypothetical protein
MMIMKFRNSECSSCIELYSTPHKEGVGDIQLGHTGRRTVLSCMRSHVHTGPYRSIQVVDPSRILVSAKTVKTTSRPQTTGPTT